MKKNIFLNLEKSLLDPLPDNASIDLGDLLSDDFFEFGSSGQKITKADVLIWFSTRPAFNYEIFNFEIIELSNDAVLATYQIKLNEKYSRRSSLWRLNNTQWQLIFHQGTNQETKEGNNND